MCRFNTFIRTTGSGRSPDATASDSLVRRLRLLNPEVTQAAVIQRGRTLGIYRRAAELRASLREPCSATYPRSATPRVMAPLSLPLASLLKHSDCLQKAKAFCNVLQSPQHRPFTSRSWRRSPGAVARGAGHLLSRQPGSPNYAARVFRCSSGAQDTTERLRSVYNETKRQTQGKEHVCSETHRCYCFYNRVVTDIFQRTNVPSSFYSIASAAFHVVGMMYCNYRKC